MIFASKIRKVYPFLDGSLLVAGLLWLQFKQPPGQSAAVMLSLVLAYGVTTLLTMWLRRRRSFRADNLLLIHQIFDLIVIAVVVNFTGGINSEFYLALFPAVVLASVVSRGWRSWMALAGTGLAYLFCVYPGGFSAKNLSVVGVRLLFLGAVGAVSYAVAHFMRSSERKLLSTLDTLNERTWELESSQVQLSNIYETTRALSGILALDRLLAEILEVGQRIFRFRLCKIYLSNVAGDCLYLHGSLENGNRRIFERPIPHVRDVSALSEIGDRTSMVRYLNQPTSETDQNTIDIPLVSRGKVMGILQVLTERGTRPSEKEQHLLMIFANAAAVAIDNSLLHKQTEELTVVDGLTQLFNYRYFRNKLSDEVRRADRYRQNLALLMLDLDHFKKINDEYGHQTGNIILREIAEIIKQCVRDVDIVARYGGEEFMVILPQTDEPGALAIAERIRAVVEKTYFSNAQGQRDIHLTISIGVTSYPNGVHTMEQLLQKVDEALYRAKADGRNAVRLAERPLKRTADIPG